MSVYRVFSKPLLQDVPGQKGVWTPPRGLSTAIFGDSFEDLSKKRADVDMWTRVSLLIIERLSVHSSWGALGGAGPCKDSRRGTLLTPLNLGEPFWCPRSACLKNGGMEVLQSAVGVDSVIGYRDRQVREAAKVEDTMTFNFTSQAPKGQSRRAWGALESIGEYWRALESTGEHWRALEGAG